MATIIKNAAFIHIPRTGSTFVRVAIRDAKIPHRNSGYPKHNVNTIHHTIRGCWNEIKDKKYVFSFVRNPLTYLQSMWVKRPRPFVKQLPFDIEECRDFQEFSAYYGKEGCKAITKTFRRFLSYNHLFVDIAKVGKLENIVEDLIDFLHLAGETFDESIIRNQSPMHVGASKISEELKYPNADIVHMIMRNESDVFRTWNYSREVDEYANLIK